MFRFVVVGGGIAGLSAAYELLQRGASVALVEADARLGGKIRTEHVGGLLVDAGPDSFLSSKPAAVQLATELGIADRLIDTLPDGGGTFILRAGKLQPLPEGITLLVPAELRSIARTPLLSPVGKLRMALDYVIPARRGDADESIGAFVRRRLGREAFERMAEPLLSGIYAGDADQLSLSSTFPRLREVEQTHGGMVRGALAQQRQASGRQASPRHTPFVSFHDGLSELVAALERALAGADIRIATSATSLRLRDDAWDVELSDGSTLTANGLLLAVPSYVAADLLAPLDARLAAVLRQVPWVSTATISLAFSKNALPEQTSGRGFVIPRAERRMLTAVTWTSRKFAGRSPDSLALLRGFVGRAGNEEPAALPEDQLIEQVRQELREILGIGAAPTWAGVFRWPRALPQYTLGHPARLDAIASRLATMPTLALTGNSYRGVGIPDCIANARRDAAALLTRIEAGSERVPEPAV
jgi:oxygen-dependent protoporphyrinogen oxidase